jgi:hypothetical protein
MQRIRLVGMEQKGAHIPSACRGKLGDNIQHEMIKAGSNKTTRRGAGHAASLAAKNNKK